MALGNFGYLFVGNLFIRRSCCFLRHLFWVADGRKLLTIRSLGNIFPVALVAKKTKTRDHWKPSREEMKDTLIMIVKVSVHIIYL